MTDLKRAGEISGAVIAAGAYLFVGGSAILWARYASLDLPATTIVSTLPRDQQFSTGVTSMLLPLLIFCVPVVLVILLNGLNDTGRAALIFAAALFVNVLLENLASRDGVISAGRTTVVLVVIVAVVVIVGFLVLVNFLRDTGGTIIGGLLVVAAAASVFASGALVSAFVVAGTGVALLALSPVVAGLGPRRATAWAGVAIVAVAVLTIRLLFEFQPPAPLPPSAVYAKATRDCVVAAHATADRCATAGYLLAQDENKVLIAVVDTERPRGAADVRHAKCRRRASGLLVVLPTEAVVEAQILGREQVSARNAETRLTLFDHVLGISEADFERHGC